MVGDQRRLLNGGEDRQTQNVLRTVKGIDRLAKFIEATELKPKCDTKISTHPCSHSICLYIYALCQMYRKRIDLESIA